MNAEKKILTSIVQLDNGSNYEVVESAALIRNLINDDFIKMIHLLLCTLQMDMSAMSERIEYLHFMRMTINKVGNVVHSTAG